MQSWQSCPDVVGCGAGSCAGAVGVLVLSVFFFFEQTTLPLTSSHRSLARTTKLTSETLPTADIGSEAPASARQGPDEGKDSKSNCDDKVGSRHVGALLSKAQVQQPYHAPFSGVYGR